MAGAHWCESCAEVLSTLRAARAELAARGAAVLIVPWDDDAAAWPRHWAALPDEWLALRDSDRARVAAVNERFGVKSVPSVAVVAASGRVLAADGLAELRRAQAELAAPDPDGSGGGPPDAKALAVAAVADYPWAVPRAAELCRLEDGGRLLAERSLVAFVEGEVAEGRTAGKEAMLELSRILAADPWGSKPGAGTVSVHVGFPAAAAPSLVAFVSANCHDSMQVRMECGLPMIHHPCVLVEVDEDEVEDRRFTADPIACTACNTVGDDMWRCAPCEFVLCAECYELNEAARATHNAEAATPVLVLIDVAGVGGCYRRACPEGITLSGALQFLEDIANGREEVRVDMTRLAEPKHTHDLHGHHAASEEMTDS